MKLSNFILFIILLIFYGCNQNQEIALNTIACGIVESKYKDRGNHEVYTFNLKEYDKSYSFIADFYPGAWAYASIGDSVIKNKGETFVTIKKTDGRFKTFETRLK